MSDNLEQPFTAHLEELRRRLIICAASVGISFLGCYFFSKQLFRLLMLPLIKAMPPEGKLVYTGLPEAFFVYMKVSLIAGILLSMPVIMYQFWMFVAPGLYEKERRWVIPIVVASSLFFVGGALFGYFVVFPVGFKFFLGYADEMIRPLPTMKDYLGFSSQLLFAFGVIFELPVIIVLLTKLGVVDTNFFATKRKYSIVLAFVLGAILTPGPDAVSQVLMAAPLILLYEVGIVVSRLLVKKMT